MHTASGASYFVATEKRWNKILTYRWLAPRVRAPIARITYHLPWHYVATSFVSRSGSSQENKGSIHYNSITSNKDTNCNESMNRQKETLKNRWLHPLLSSRGSDTIASIVCQAMIGQGKRRNWEGLVRGATGRRQDVRGEAGDRHGASPARVALRFGPR
jgi:hypothetical protein